MATMYRYQLPVDQTGWTLQSETETSFTWEYEDERAKLLALYDKGKKQQWDAAVRIDWSLDLDPENPQQIDDRLIPIYGSAVWNRLTDKEKVRLRHHQQAQSLSQFMHGEQGALMAAARIVQTVPDLDAKFYAATQVMDEARHVEAYARLLNEKLGIAYPITPGLKALRLAASVNAYVMQDEARHVAFGRLALRDYYPQLSQAERDEREEFVVAACYHMRDRFNQRELWENLGLPVSECIEVAMASDNMRLFRKRLFSRIVPTVKDIGLWGPRVQKAFADMGALEFADVDSDAQLEQDNRVAEEFDAGRFVRDGLPTDA